MPCLPNCDLNATDNTHFLLCKAQTYPFECSYDTREPVLYVRVAVDGWETVHSQFPCWKAKIWPLCGRKQKVSLQNAKQQRNYRIRLYLQLREKNHSTKLVFMEEWWKKGTVKKALWNVFWNLPNEMQTGDTVVCIWGAAAVRLQGKLRFL